MSSRATRVIASRTLPLSSRAERGISSRAYIARGSAVALLLLAALPNPAEAQVRLPGVQVTAAPDPPGPKLFAGVVRDTLGYPIEGVEVLIPNLKRSTVSGANGEFSFIDMPRGKILMRARKFGFGPQNREFDTGINGGVGEFALVPLPYSMPAIITSTARGGLSGVVADTSYVPIPGVLVNVFDKGFLALTDSDGTFFIPAPPGKFVISLSKDGYASRVTGVSIPEDSGRKVSLMLLPPHDIPVREANNLRDLQSRMAWNVKINNPFYTREDIQKMGITWIIDLVRAAGMDQYNDDCHVTVNGGPAEQNVAELTVDDVEAVEIFGGSRFTKPKSMVSAKVPPIVITSINGGQRRPAPPRVTGGNVPITNTDRAGSSNQGKVCPVVYVWTR